MWGNSRDITGLRRRSDEMVGDVVRSGMESK